MALHILWFVVGLVLLIKGGDWFVDGASGIAKKFNLPEVLIGATVVSIGTTLPEVMVSATSALEGHGSMAYGNAIGSIICNTALVAAITVAVKPAVVNKKSLYVPVAFFFVAAGIYAGTAYTSQSFGRATGIILLVLFAAYLAVTVIQTKRSPIGNDSVKASETGKEASEKAEEEKKEKEHPVWWIIGLVIVGAALIAVGSRLLVDHGVEIAKAIGISESVIALTFIALGTSLPELVTAITSLVKGHGSLSIGNICGANLFNLVLVSGVSITIGPFEIKEPEFVTKTFFGKEMFSSLVIDTPLMILVMALLTLPVLIKGKLYRWQGITLLLLYAGFCVLMFI